MPMVDEIATLRAERDEALAEVDFMAKCFGDLGAAFNRRLRIDVQRTAEGVEVRMLFASQADAEAAAAYVRDLRNMVLAATKLPDAA